MTQFLSPRWMIGCRLRVPHSFIFVKQGEKYVWLGTAANLDSVAEKKVCHSGGIEPQMS
jgi:hypothetical protein